MRPKALISIICLVAIMLGTASSWAEEDFQMKVRELRVLPVHKLKRVAVGDPAIADVTVLSTREVMVVAKGVGVTSLIVWDALGQHSYNIIVIEKDLEKAAEKVRGVLVSSDLLGLNVKVEEDKIYVSGDAATQGDMDRVQDVLAPFTEVVSLVRLKERQPLVEVDVEVLEIAHNDLKDLGIDWSDSLPITYSEPTGSRIEGKSPKVWKVFRWDRTTIDAKLNMLITEHRGRTLANPKLVTISGKEASFLVGGEVPYVTVETEGRTRVGWRVYGVNLRILPLVNAKNEIRTKLHAEITDLDWDNAVEQEGYRIPALKKREAKTELILNEEDTIFIAGLIKNDYTRDVERLPWLSKVPVLGELFKSSDFMDKRTELVIALTPKIIGEKANPEYLAQEMIRQEAILAAQRRFPAYSEEDSPLAYYSHMVEDMISSGVVYPAEAQHEQQEGIVKIDLYILSNGQLNKAEVRESSGFKLLDEAALLAVEQQAPFPSFPSQITQRQLRITVPVVFKSYARNE